ncbi:hypothetical protein RQP46_005239 [Phenoliferia psychrophenolica]
MSSNAEDTPRTTITSLPTELITRIVRLSSPKPSWDNASERSAHLRNLALVCRAFRGPAQEELFRHVVLPSAAASRAFVAVIKSGGGARFASTPRSLRAGEDGDVGTDQESFALPFIAKCCSRLEAVWLRRIDLLDVVAVASGPAMKKLLCRGCKFVATLHGPKAKALSLTRLGIRDCGGSAHLDPHSFPNVLSLDISLADPDDYDDVNAFANSLGEQLSSLCVGEAPEHADPLVILKPYLFKSLRNLDSRLHLRHLTPFLSPLPSHIRHFRAEAPYLPGRAGRYIWASMLIEAQLGQSNCSCLERLEHLRCGTVDLGPTPSTKFAEKLENLLKVLRPETLTLPTPATPSSLPLHLLAALYAPFLPSLVLASGTSISLSSAGGETVTGLASVAAQLFADAGKTDEALGATEEDKKEVLAWLDRIAKFEFVGQDALKALDTELSTRTYLVGSTPTAADYSLVAALYPNFSQAPHSAHLSHPSLSRHFDHIQHLPSIAAALTRAQAEFGPSPVPINAADVPVVEVKPEVKVKKVPKGDAAAVPAKEAVKEAATVEKDAAAPKEKEEAGAGQVKREKKEKKPAAPKAKAPEPVIEAPAPWMVDLRVGKIIDVKLHPDADAMYVETIDCGEAEPRTVVSGLVNYIPIEQMRGKTLITVCNLKPANLRGIKSFAMVLCASSKDGKSGGIEFVDPPEGSLPGDRVYFEGFEANVPVDQLNPKRKIFETVQPGFTTLDTKEAAWVSEDKKVHRIMSAKGVCTVPTLVGASLS